jgi:hypothetical protein
MSIHCNSIKNLRKLYSFVKTKSIHLLYKGKKMIRKLFKSGNGWAIFIPKTILELLKVNPETDLLEIQIENDVLKIKKVKDKNKQ